VKTSECKKEHSVKRSYFFYINGTTVIFNSTNSETNSTTGYSPVAGIDPPLWQKRAHFLHSNIAFRSSPL
jgi:hypothetical protein